MPPPRPSAKVSVVEARAPIRPNIGTAAEKLLTYALGRRVEYYDMPAVRGIVREAAPGDFRLSSIVLGIVRSTPFQMKRKEGGPTP